MANSDKLRRNRAQHIPKNRESKFNDKAIYPLAIVDCISYRSRADLISHHDRLIALKFSENSSSAQRFDLIRVSKTRSHEPLIQNVGQTKGQLSLMTLLSGF